MAKRKAKRITAEELGKRFDAGEDVSDNVGRRAAAQAVSINIPIWALKKTERECARRNVAREPRIMGWIIDRMDGLNEMQGGAHDP